MQASDWPEFIPKWLPAVVLAALFAVGAALAAAVDVFHRHRASS